MSISQEVSDSDQEAPTLQLCCHSQSQLRALDLGTTEDVSTVLAAKDRDRVYAAATQFAEC